MERNGMGNMVTSTIKKCIAFSACFCLTLLCFLLILPAGKVSADYFELKTNAKRTGKIIKEDEIVDGSIVSVVENNDFRITLKTDGTEYHAGDAIRIKAEVEYTGSKKETELESCDQVVVFRVEGSNGIKGDSYTYYNQNALQKIKFKKGEVYEYPFSVSYEMGFRGNLDEIFGTDRYDQETEESILHLPQGTYTVTAALSNELLDKKPASFYAELHINVDLEGDVFYSGSNLYRTMGEDEAVLIGTKTDNPQIWVGSLEPGKDPLIVPESVKYNSKNYKVTVIGDEGITYFGYVDDYSYGYINYGTFTGKNFSDVKIPASVRKISKNAFLDTSLLSLQIDAGDLDICDMAFRGAGYFGECGELVIKGGNVRIGYMAFDYSWFKTVDLHKLKKLEIGEQGLADLYALREISLPENTVSIGNKAFYDSGERNDKIVLTIPKGTEKIDGPVANKLLIKVAEGNEKFVERYGLLLTADGSKVLGISDFRVKEITMPEGVTEIMPYAFSQTTITKLVIPDTVTVIPEGMACMANSLKSVKLGKNVKEIGKKAFWICKIKKITLPTGLKSIGENAFANCRLKKVTIPKSVENIGNNAFSGNNVTITFKKKNKNYTQSGTVIFKKGTKTVVGLAGFGTGDTKYDKLDLQFVLKGSIYNLTIPETVKEIDISSFSAGLMGEYYSGKYEVYEGAEIVFEGKEPPKFVDGRNSLKEFFIWIFIPEDADPDAYKEALEEAGLVEGKNFKLSSTPYEDPWDF